LKKKKRIDVPSCKIVAKASCSACAQSTKPSSFSNGSLRHAVLHDEENGDTFTPLHHVPDQKASFDIHNSPLSEAAVVGFEYGYT
jgi:2-oxoglutarate dehydrogenase complex dehydrogenase (E1) component-like enzyme